MPRHFLRAALTCALATPHAVHAQESRRSVDLTVNGTGISIGDSRGVNGLRINFRDTRLERVNGVNITAWTPTRTSGGIVNGAAIGIPGTGAAEINGLGIGIGGVGTGRRFRGIGIGGLGIGGGGTVEGLLIGGLGVGSGGGVRGISVGGLGVGSGGDIIGFSVGGLGVGGGGRVRGISVGGIGVGGPGDITGLSIGGVGVGGGGNIRGISIGGIGVGGGGSLAGLTIAGVGIGNVGGIRGVQVAGVGIGSTRVDGITVAGVMAGGVDLRGFVYATGLVRVEGGNNNGVALPGTITGATVSAVNYIKGTQRGLAVGIVNSAWTLDGVQIGLINHARNNPPGLRWLPILNVNLPDR